MYKVVQKLKRVKANMKELNKQGFNNIQAEDSRTHQELVAIQEKLHNDPMNVALIMEEEKEATQHYNLAHKKYIQFLKQKAKVAWLREGDDNTALFHNCHRKRTVQNHVYAIRDKTGAVQDSSEGIQAAFVDYYSDLLGWKMGDRDTVKSDIARRGPVLIEEQKKRMTQSFSRREVKEAIFSIHGDKSPGPDGFRTDFYKHN
ncbi:LINE-1 retrotransposable element ORF2 protein [Bienertia sinuspersici]